MSIRKYVHQVRPIQEGFLEPAIKIQKFLSEASLKDKSELFKTTPRKDGTLNKDIFVDLATKGELSGVDGKALPKVKSDDPFLVSIKNAKTKEEIPNEKFNTKPEFGLSDVEKTVDFGGQSAAATGKPKGADSEDIITSKYNELINKPDHDLNANESAKTFGKEYLDAGEGIAKGLLNLGLSEPMTQFGASGSKKNLSDFWIESGGKSGTPKTDMYTSNYNISLKKKGGSQLASGMAGETLATFNAALEYMGTTKEGEKEISDIMDKIEKNFTKLLTDNTIDKIRELEKKKNLSPAEKKLVGDYVTTEEFHKKLNEQIAKDLTMENKQTFREWFVYEAMSGYKKFNSGISLARASICVEFDDKKGEVSKSYNVTPQGKSSGLTEKPSVSSDVKNIASKVKIYAAWKTGSGNPYSALRLGMSDYYTPMKFSFFNSTQTTETLSDIIRNEILNDNIANAILKEDIHKLDEFAILRKAMTKLKDMGKSVKTYIQGILGKIMKKVKATFNKIKTLGKLAFQKLFEFLGIKLQSVRVSDTFMFSFGNME